MSTKLRQKEINRIREEGFQAAKKGQHIQTNPYPKDSMDHFQWELGHRCAVSDTFVAPTEEKP